MSITDRIWSRGSGVETAAARALCGAAARVAVFAATRVAAFSVRVSDVSAKPTRLVGGPVVFRLANPYGARARAAGVSLYRY